jgi:serine/threonine-protein kinase SRPK3
MFSGKDPEYQAYRSRAHLASMVSLLGLPSSELMSRGSRGARFFSNGV